MYNMVVLPRALGYLNSIDRSTARRIISKMTYLSENFESITPQPLAGSMKGFYKLRIGDWRVIYDFNHEERMITVHRIGHRREIYEIR